MAKKHRAGGNERAGSETTEEKGPIEAEIERISNELGGYEPMVAKLKDDPRFHGINKSTFSYWIRQERDKKPLKTKRLRWALDLLGGSHSSFRYLKLSCVDNIWNLPIKLICWQSPTSREGQDPDFRDLRSIGLGRLSNQYKIVATVDHVNSGTEALARLRDDSDCALAIVASDLINHLAPPLYRVCPISRPQIEGLTRTPIEHLLKMRRQTLGFPEGSAVADVVLDFLKERGARPPVFVDLPGDDVTAIATAFRSGEIEGFLGWQPQLGRIEAELGSEIGLNPISWEFLPRMRLDVIINYRKIPSPDIIWDFLHALREAVEGIERRKHSRKDKFASEVADFLKSMSGEDVEKSLQGCKFSVPYIRADVAIKLARPAKRSGGTDV